MRISNETKKIIEKQFALDCNLGEAEEIKEGEIYLSKSKNLKGARIVEKTDLFFRAVLYDGKAFLMADKSIYAGCKEIFKDAEAEWFCKYSNLRLLDRILQEYGYEIADTHIYYLPDQEAKDIHMELPVVWYNQNKINCRMEDGFFPHALCHSCTQPDYLAVAAVLDKKEIAMAGASIDGRYTRQIGIDVKKEYRGRGIAPYLVNLLKQKITAQAKIEDADIIPFYGTSESHSFSRQVAIKAGFFPAWCEIYIKKINY